MLLGGVGSPLGCTPSPARPGGGAHPPTRVRGARAQRTRESYLTSSGGGIGYRLDRYPQSQLTIGFRITNVIRRVDMGRAVVHSETHPGTKYHPGRVKGTVTGSC